MMTTFVVGRNRLKVIGKADFAACRLRDARVPLRGAE
jgi:hypothetical protein